jgi:uncharacterized protein (DUF58 family)
MTQGNSSTGSPTSRYLRIEDLRRLRHVQFTSRRTVEGYFLGRHRSPQRGYSVEFSDYREYTPGDDVSAMDWKVFGRSDRLYIKLFEHESDMTVNLLVDASASMAYAGIDQPADAGQDPGGSWLDRVSLMRRKRKGPPRILRKYDYACTMAATIAFLTIRQQDRVGFAAARQGLAEYREPAGSTVHLHQLLAAMERVIPTGSASLADALDDLARRTRRRSVLIVFSDLLEGREEVMKKLSVFRARGGDVIVFHVMHPDELQLPSLDNAVFIDSETSRRMTLNVPDIRDAYARTLAEFLDGWSLACSRAGFDYNLVSTAKPFTTSLERYFLARAATMT